MKRLLFGLVLATGCMVEGPPTEQPPTGQPPTGQLPRTARQMFEQDVFPILLTNCGACHATVMPTVLGFLRADAVSTYPTFVEDDGLVGDFTPETAKILTEQNTSTHFPRRYTPDEWAKITAWLKAEAANRR